MENTGVTAETHENKIAELQLAVSELESRVSALSDETKKAEGRLEKSLLKQIEVLSVFTVILALIITNVIGIDALGGIGLRGLAKLDLVFVLSTLVLLLGVKLIIIGFEKK